MYLGYVRTVQDDFESYKRLNLYPCLISYKACPLYYKLSIYVNVRGVGEGERYYYVFPSPSTYDLTYTII